MLEPKTAPYASIKSRAWRISGVAVDYGVTIRIGRSSVYIRSDQLRTFADFLHDTADTNDRNGR